MIKKNYIVLLIFLVIIIITNQVIIQVDISKQFSDAKIINIAGKQRMYSQQITKMALYTRELKNTPSYYKNIETLKKIIDTFKTSQKFLKKRNKINYKNTNIDSLFEINNPFYNTIVNSSERLINDQNNGNAFDNFVLTTKNNEVSYLRTMDDIVDRYQVISEKRLDKLKKVQQFFILFTSVSLIALLIFMFFPLFKKNKTLINLNKELEDFKKKIELKEKERKKIETILESVSKVARIGTWEVDLKNDVLYLSDITKQIHELELDFVLPSVDYGIQFYKEGKSRERILEAFNKTIETGIPYKEELQLITAKGNEVWVRTIGQPEYEDGKCIRVYGTFQDINNQKSAEVKLKSQNKDLKDKSRKLEVISKKLVDQNSKLANFAHISSHNLRAPVSNLNSLLNLYDISDKDDKKVIFNKFRTVIGHLSATLNTLIEAIKIDGKKTEDLETKEVSFSDVLEKVADQISEEINKSETTIKSDFSQLKTITYDETYLESILMNLLTNSIKYSSKERKPSIEVMTRFRNGTKQLIVSDNGLGIDLKKHGHKLFGLNKVFHRHKDSKGVGLYLVKNQIESLGGKIYCISKVDKGTTFIITF